MKASALKSDVQGYYEVRDPKPHEQVVSKLEGLTKVAKAHELYGVRGLVAVMLRENGNVTFHRAGDISAVEAIGMLELGKKKGTEL